MKVLLFFIFSLLFVFNSEMFSQKVYYVTVKKGENIRQIAKDNLGNAELWIDILKDNGIKAAHDVKEGVKLKIDEAIKFSFDKIKWAESRIDIANKNGAESFAAATFKSAKSSLSAAKQAREKGDWKTASSKADESSTFADRASAEAIKSRESVSEAILSDKKGSVEQKTPSAVNWVAANITAKLMENDRIRTLSNSFAELTFQNNNKLRLAENSDAIILKSRVDLFTQKNETEVSLQKGEGFAILEQNSKNKKFDLNTPGVETNTDSKNYWVQNDQKSTKVSNYDGKIEIKAMDSVVVIAKNEGSVVPANQKPSQPIKLLEPPRNLSPTLNKIVLDLPLEFTWGVLDGAVSYKFMLSSDSKFSNIIADMSELKSNSYTVNNLDPGTYYWRVFAIDRHGLLGVGSETNKFFLNIDTIPPFLTINLPEGEILTYAPSIDIYGETEPDALLEYSGKSVSLDKTGKFSFRIELSQGLNSIKLSAKDPKGNITNKIVTIKRELFVTNDLTISEPQIDGNNFIVSSGRFNIRGVTKPGLTVELGIAGFKTKAVAGTDGSFFILVPISKSGDELVISVSSNNVQIFERKFIVTVE